MSEEGNLGTLMDWLNDPSLAACSLEVAINQVCHPLRAKIEEWVAWLMGGHTENTSNSNGVFGWAQPCTAGQRYTVRRLIRSTLQTLRVTILNMMPDYLYMHKKTLLLSIADVQSLLSVGRLVSILTAEISK